VAPAAVPLQTGKLASAYCTQQHSRGSRTISMAYTHTTTHTHKHTQPHTHTHTHTHTQYSSSTSPHCLSEHWAAVVTSLTNGAPCLVCANANANPRSPAQIGQGCSSSPVLPAKAVP